MKRIPVMFDLSPTTLERLDAAVRIGRQRLDPVLADMERNQVLQLALEVGLRQLEDRLGVGNNCSHDAPSMSGVFSRAAEDSAGTERSRKQTVRGTRR
jgi:hypothetical protein